MQTHCNGNKNNLLYDSAPYSPWEVVYNVHETPLIVIQQLFVKMAQQVPDEIWFHHIIPFAIDLSEYGIPSFQKLSLVCKKWSNFLMNFSTDSTQPSVWPILLKLEKDETLEDFTQDESDWRRIYTFKSLPKISGFDAGMTLNGFDGYNFVSYGTVTPFSFHFLNSPVFLSLWLRNHPEDVVKCGSLTSGFETLNIECYDESLVICKPQLFISKLNNTMDIIKDSHQDTMPYFSTDEEKSWELTEKRLINEFTGKVWMGLKGEEHLETKPETIEQLEKVLNDESVLVLHFHKISDIIFGVVFAIYGKDGKGFLFEFYASD